MNSSFLMALGRHDGGLLVENADELLRDVIRDVTRYGQKGKVTLDLIVEPNGEKALKISFAVRATLPKRPVCSITWPKAAPGKARPRATYNPHIGRSIIYTPDQTARQEDDLQIWARDAMQGRPLHEGPLMLRVRAFYAPPKSWSGRKAAAALGTPKTSKPDIDNVVKLIKDALNGVVWVDDAQVAWIDAGKFIGARNETVIEVLEPEQIRAPATVDPQPQGELL